MKPFLKKSFLCVVVIFAIPAGLLHFASESTRVTMMFNRDAIAHGEWWRLVTGHWMHFGSSHLWWNLAVTCSAAFWLERIHAGVTWRFTTIAAPALGVLLFYVEPAMHTYGGLSGITCGLVTLLALLQLSNDRARRIWWVGLLVVIGVKIAFENFQAVPLFSRFDHADYRVSVWAHAGGALIATGFFLSLLRLNSCPLLPAAASSYDETHT